MYDIYIIGKTYGEVLWTKFRDLIKPVLPNFINSCNVSTFQFISCNLSERSNMNQE